MDLKKEKIKHLSGFLPQESTKATEKSICLGLCSFRSVETKWALY